MTKDADLVITGEGSADRQTLMGKLPTVSAIPSQLFYIPHTLLKDSLALAVRHL